METSLKKNYVDKEIENDDARQNSVPSQQQGDAELGEVGEDAKGAEFEDTTDNCSSSSSTSSFINWMDFYRIFSLSALYIIVSGLFFIWLLLTIFKRLDVSQVSYPRKLQPGYFPV